MKQNSATAVDYGSNYEPDWFENVAPSKSYLLQPGAVI